MKRIYLDYASLTPIDRRVLRVMKRYSSDKYANPSSIYREGVAAKKALEDAHKRVGEFIRAHADEIVFTSGGTEANNLAILGTIKTAQKKGIERPHLIISNIEHSSIIETANDLEKNGVEVTRLTVNSFGQISLDDLKKAIKPNTVLVSIMTVNNEIGTIQPIREIAKVIRSERTRRREQCFSTPASWRIEGDTAPAEGVRHYPLFHTDAAQAALYCELNIEWLGVDLLTLDGSKVYGPRGIGALYVKRDTPIEPIIHGGGQEKGMRSGTENLPAIMGLAEALYLSKAVRSKEAARLTELKDYFLGELKKIKPDIKINPPVPDDVSNRYNLYVITHSPHILNVSIPGIDNEFFLLQLDAKGVAVSTKSSCLRDSDESYVLKAIAADSKTAIRFSFGRFTKKSHARAVNKKILAILGGF